MKVSFIVKTSLFVFYLYVALKILWLMCRRKVQHRVEIEYIPRQAKMPKVVELSLTLSGRQNISAIYGRFERPIRLSTDFKYILRWTKAISHYTKFIDRTGQQTFIDHGCERIDCIMTNDDRMLNDYRHFDAIIFDVENVWDYLPAVRAPHQNYVFLAQEAASTYPRCDPFYDDYYNLTWTYRLDSDIRWSFLSILNMKDEEVGPKPNMTWMLPNVKPPSKKLQQIVSTKSKAVAWFVSNCRARSGRNEVVRELREALSKYDLEVDVFGGCGKKQCDRAHMKECLEGMGKIYYFYLAFENSLCEDYVTEKLLHAVQHNTVPIVYGGADYSRFLPPASYLDATKDTPKQLAKEIRDAIDNKDYYFSFFWWQDHYKYTSSQPIHDVCQLCKTLHERTDVRSSIKNFRQWWHSDYKRLCDEKMKELQNRPRLLVD